MNVPLQEVKSMLGQLRLSGAQDSLEECSVPGLIDSSNTKIA